MIKEFVACYDCYQCGMNTTSTYRWVGITMALVFAVFSIGVPIVVASCPMMNAGFSRAACCPAQSENSVHQLTAPKNFSCCKSVIAAERNKTEFMQMSDFIHNAQQVVSSTLFLPALSGLGNTVAVINIRYISHSPPYRLDLPVFFSSLLI